MAKQIFVLFLEQFSGRLLDDVPLFSLLPYEEWMTEADIADFVRKKFSDILTHHNIDVGLNMAVDFQDTSGRQIGIEEIAEAAIAHALEEDYQFWWLQDELEDSFDLISICRGKACLVSCMDSAAKARGWV